MLTGSSVAWIALAGALAFVVVALVIVHIAKTRRPTRTTSNPFRRDFNG